MVVQLPELDPTILFLVTLSRLELAPWGHFKSQVYQNNPRSLEDLKDAVKSAVRRLSLSDSCFFRHYLAALLRQIFFMPVSVGTMPAFQTTFELLGCNRAYPEFMRCHHSPATVNVVCRFTNGFLQRVRTVNTAI